MNYLLAKTDEELGLCLRMLFSEKLNPVKVKTALNKDKKIEFQVYFDTDEILFEELHNRYETLLS